MITLSKLLQSTAIQVKTDCDITGLSLDSRTVKPGDLFFACQGTALDGRQYIAEAIQKGAKAILAEASSTSPEFYQNDLVPVYTLKNLKAELAEIAACFYQYPTQSQKIIGVTGTNGKTSCSHFIAAALQELNRPCGVIGTLGNGLYGQIKPGTLTTPDPITLQKTFAEFKASGANYVSMEVSSHSLDQGRVNAIDFAVGIFTNLTRTHLDYHHTMEAYGAAKKKLFDNLHSGAAVINSDDAFGVQIIESLRAHKKVYAYGFNPQSAAIKDIPLIFADQIALDLLGIHARVHTPWGAGDLHAKVIGEFNLSNLLAVLTTLCVLEIPLATSLNCLAHLNPVPGRMQTLGGQNQPLVVVDYSHTPDALEKALLALRRHCQGKLFCVFGCGGDRDRGMRPMMAAVAERYADRVVVTDDNVRTEDPQQIMADIMQGFTDPSKIIIQHDRSKAIKDVIQYATAGDCILIAGKGAETYQLIGQQKIPFSDSEEVSKNLTEIK